MSVPPTPWRLTQRPREPRVPVPRFPMRRTPRTPRPQITAHGIREIRQSWLLPERYYEGASPGRPLSRFTCRPGPKSNAVLLHITVRLLHSLRRAERRELCVGTL